MKSQARHLTAGTSRHADQRKRGVQTPTCGMTKRRFHIFLNRQGFKQKILDDETIKKCDKLRNRRKYNRNRDPWW